MKPHFYDLVFGGNTSIQEANLLNILPDQLKLQVRRSQAGDTWRETNDDLIRLVVSIFFNFHPYLGKIPILTNIFQLG